MSTPLKVALTVLVIALVGLAAGFGVRALMKPKITATTDQSTTTSAYSDDLTVGSGKNFAWGISVLTFPFPTYRESFTGTQMAEAKKLGVNYVRVDYLPTNQKAADLAVNEARKNGLKVVLIIPFGPKDIFSDANLRQDATQYVTDIVKHYKGKVAVYQLATEVASVALNNDASKHGLEIKDYPPARLEAVTTWLLAATSAVKATDPSAKRLINDQWVHVGFFDNYFAKGGDTDILGWNWFSDMGNTMDTVTLNAKAKQTFDLLTKIKGYNKPIWLTEVSRRLGSQGNNEKAQADFISTMTSYVANHPEIKGFFVYNLLEDQAAPIQERGYSLITAVDEATQKVTGHKAAFTTYQNIIQQAR